MNTSLFILIPVILVPKSGDTLTLEEVQLTHTNSATKHKFIPWRLLFSFLLHPCIFRRSREEGESSASHYTYGKYVRLNSTVHVWKMSRFLFFFKQMSADLFWAGGQGFRSLINNIKEWAKDTHFFPSIYAIALKNNNNIIWKFSYHRGCSTRNQCRGRKVCSNGRYWPILCLPQQTVYVTRQTGSGAHCMVPQNEDCIIQSVQAILHSRLEEPEGSRNEGLGEREKGREEGQSSLV